jgi:hypothetical protein
MIDSMTEPITERLLNYLVLMTLCRFTFGNLSKYIANRGGFGLCELVNNFLDNVFRVENILSRDFDHDACLIIQTETFSEKITNGMHNLNLIDEKTKFDFTYNEILQINEQFEVYMYLQFSRMGPYEEYRCKSNGQEPDINVFKELSKINSTNYECCPDYDKYINFIKTFKTVRIITSNWEQLNESIDDEFIITDFVVRDGDLRFSDRSFMYMDVSDSSSSEEYYSDDSEYENYKSIIYRC